MRICADRPGRIARSPRSFRRKPFTEGVLLPDAEHASRCGPSGLRGAQTPAASSASPPFRRQIADRSESVRYPGSGPSALCHRTILAPITANGHISPLPSSSVEQSAPRRRVTSRRDQFRRAGKQQRSTSGSNTTRRRPTPLARVAARASIARRTSTAQRRRNGITARTPRRSGHNSGLPASAFACCCSSGHRIQ